MPAEFRKTPPAPFKLTDITAPRPEIKTKITPVSDGSVCLIVTVEGVLPEGSVGDLVVHTDDPATPELRIPVHVVKSTPAPAPTVTSVAQVQPAIPTETVIAAVATAYQRKPEELSAAAADDEAAEVAVWLVSKLSAKTDAAGARAKLGGISPLRFARTRDAVSRRMESDPVFAKKCQALLQSLAKPGPTVDMP